MGSMKKLAVGVMIGFAGLVVAMCSPDSNGTTAPDTVFDPVFAETVCSHIDCDTATNDEIMKLWGEYKANGGFVEDGSEHIHAGPPGGDAVTPCGEMWDVKRLTQGGYIFFHSTNEPVPPNENNGHFENWAFPDGAGGFVTAHIEDEAYVHWDCDE